MPKRAVILSNGDVEQPELMKKRVEAWDPRQVIAANGGLRHATALGLTVDALVGDLDSIDERALSSLELAGVQIERRSAEKDEIDLELALLHAVEAEAHQVAVLGAVGDRLDMTIANVLLLTLPALEAARIEVWQGQQTAWIIRPPGEEIPGLVGDTLSLIPLGISAEGITTQNLAFPLRAEDLATGPARGISNLISGRPAWVKLTAGLLLAVHTPGRV